MQIAPKVNGHSPWGWIQSVKEMSEGMWFVSTAGHGGIKLSRQLNAKMPKQFRREGGWYEEDCEVSLVVLAFPDRFTPVQVKDAEVSAKNWFPAAYESWTGTEIPLAESMTKRGDHFAKVNQDNWIVISALGSWHQKVPQGMVGGVATKGGATRGSAGERCFLIPEAEYAQRSPFGFVVDPARHEEVAGF